jgi:hypothetical protein
MFNPEWVLERVRDVLSIAEAADGARKKGQRRRGALTPAV